MSDLASMECIPCKGGVPPLEGEELESYHERLGGDWEVVDGHHLEKQFEFENFAEALAFTNRIGELAESVNHHPDLELGWGYVRVKLWTHKIDGLSEADFVWAAKADRL